MLFRSKKDIPLKKNLIKLFNKSYKRQYGNFKFDLIIDFLSNDLEQSLIFACSNLNTVLVKNKETNHKIYNQFDKIYDIDNINIEDILPSDI